MTLKLGTAKMAITPSAPVRMAGYATRTQVYDQVLEDIYTRVYSFRQGSTHILLIYADLLWWNPTFLSMARPKLSKKLGLKEDHLIFIASHNHSGPGTGDAFIPLLETADPEYVSLLYKTVEQAAHQAIHDEEDVSAYIHRGNSSINVYRRVLTESGIAMAPNYDILADHDLTALRFIRSDNSIKGILVHYPCHANLANGNALHPDYPGITLGMLDRDNPGCISMFLQGCTADLRPNSVLGTSFIPQDLTGVKSFADQFYSDCIAALNTVGTPLEGSMCIIRDEIRLFLDQSSVNERIAAAATGDIPCTQWKEICEQKNFRNFEMLEVTLLKLGDLSMFFFNAEVAQYYAAFIRRLCPGAIGSGYSNGMIGYLSSAAQISEGGYEPDGSAVYFAVAGTYPTSTQNAVEETIKQLLKSSR